MSLNLNPEQIAYLKGLDSKEKRREFLLDCLVENVIGESAEIDPSKVISFKNGEFKATSQEQIDFLSGFKGNLFTTTTAPRTFYAIDEERKNYRIGEVIDFVAEEVKKEISKSEESKWDKNPKLEDIIKSKLIIRGFKNEDLLNNRGLIGATIDETVIEVVKNYRFANT